MALSAAAILVVLVLALAVLMIVTPSVGDAEVIARSQAVAHGAPFPGPPVPARFAAALIATEDHRFYGEPGIDPIAVGRVVLGWMTGGGDQGGATLYQQLAKQLYTPGQGGPAVEAEQAALAIKLKFGYSAAEILRMYSAVEYFGHGFYGLAQASCGYFGQTPAGLTWAQGALLAGLVQAPTAYDPLVHPHLARARQEHVVARLVATGRLSAAQAAGVLARPISRLVQDAGRNCRA